MILTAIVLIIIGLISVLIFLSRYEDVPDGIETSSVTKPFYKCGTWIYENIIGNEKNGYYKKMFDKFRQLNPAGNIRVELKGYMVSKVGIVLLILFVGSIFVGLIGYKDSRHSVFEQDGVLKRDERGGESYTITLDAAIGSEGDLVEGMEIVINEEKYTEEEFREALPEFYEQLEEDILGENQSLDYVNKDLNLVEKIDGYPFFVDWSSSELSIMKSTGKLGENIPEDGIIVTLNAKVTYEEYSQIYIFSAYVFPRELTYTQMLSKRLSQLIEAEDEESREEEYLELPSNLDGASITWKEEKKKNALIFGALVIAAAIAILAGQDKDLDKQIELRNQQLLVDYPELVSKLTLFIGAGMPIKAAWKKICQEYKQRKDENPRYVYEEMLITAYEMDSGISEMTCYSRFADRVRVQKYVKLMSIINQNLKLGSKTFIIEMTSESKDAFEERKHLAKRQGEVAGTKLMLPMFMMLAIVIAVIMVPAFMNI